MISHRRKICCWRRLKAKTGLKYPVENMGLYTCFNYRIFIHEAIHAQSKLPQELLYWKDKLSRSKVSMYQIDLLLMVSITINIYFFRNFSEYAMRSSLKVLVFTFYARPADWRSFLHRGYTGDDCRTGQKQHADGSDNSPQVSITVLVGHSHGFPEYWMKQKLCILQRSSCIKDRNQSVKAV